MLENKVRYLSESTGFNGAFCVFSTPLSALDCRLFSHHVTIVGRHMTADKGVQKTPKAP